MHATIEPRTFGAPSRGADDLLLREIARSGRAIEIDADTVERREHFERLLKQLRRSAFWCVEREHDEDVELILGDLVASMTEPTAIVDAIHADERLEKAVRRGLRLIVVPR